VTTFTGPAGPFHAMLRVPGDKSLSHRALLIGAMAAGRSVVRGLGPGTDVAATRTALESLGVRFDDHVVDSPGVDGWHAAPGPIDAANSGTTMRLLTGALAGRPFRSVLVGDESLMSRPMRRLAAPLGVLGASVTVSDAGTPPVVVEGRSLRGAAVTVAIASAQVRTAVALAALQASGDTTIVSPPGFRDHTERWLAHLGLGERTTDTVFRVTPAPIRPIHAELPGDTSSAAFLWAAAAASPGASVTIRSVSLNPGRTGFLDVLAAMGARVDQEPDRPVLGDPVGTVTVAGSDLRGITVAGPLTVRALDELPLVAVLAAIAEGTTVVSDAAELRTKETDRIATTVGMIRALGGRAQATADGFVVEGAGLRPGTVRSAGDHRIAMAAAVAASRAGSVTIDGFEASSVSWPGFARVLEETWAS
jgi:3-phosphoshikimate 1-carboxyvinyltransferase